MVTRTKKMFVGGLSASTTIDDVKAYFESYGKVKPHDVSLLLAATTDWKITDQFANWEQFCFLK